ncbi:hypothetical protein GMO_27210 [Gluconobacter morbifer G707]|uniref:Uncharacterized protein n=1 Tax=Gluconobacter morbifer G707 TaxID=1088869 RepID=G6XMK3_9PROT|nr:hypothetical protein GMO_27210 [Gluconobacter morbifer G707]
MEPPLSFQRWACCLMGRTDLEYRRCPQDAGRGRPFDLPVHLHVILS